jgi:hypothetical protein
MVQVEKLEELTIAVLKHKHGKVQASKQQHFLLSCFFKD